MVRVLPTRIHGGAERGVISWDKGYKLNQHKKENDLYWLLNLACYKFTGHFLPEPCSTNNTWTKFVNGDERIFAVPSPLPTHTIMSWDGSDGLDKQIKRSMICGEIKAIRNNYWWYRDQYELLATKLGGNQSKVWWWMFNQTCGLFNHRTADGNWRGDVDWTDIDKSCRDRSNDKVKSVLKHLAYKVLTGVDEDVWEAERFVRQRKMGDNRPQGQLPTYKELAEFVKLSVRPKIDKPKLCYLFQDIWYQESYKVRGKRIDHLLCDAVQINKNIDSKNCIITRQNKIRKGREQEFMNKYLMALPYLTVGHHRYSDTPVSVRDKIHAITRGDCCFGASAQQFLPPSVWFQFNHKNGDRIPMDEYIGAMNGVPKNRFELIEKKLIKNFC